MDETFETGIGSDIAEIPAVSARLEAAMQGYGFAPGEILDTQLAVEEVVTNIILHGYKKPDGEIRISCRISSSLIGIQITDTAPPFNPLLIPEPDLEGNVDEQGIGGLGVYLLRQVMDDISYRYENGKNILTLVKRRAS